MNKLKYKKVETNRAESPLISQQYRNLLDKQAKFASTLTPRLESKPQNNKGSTKQSLKTKPFNGTKYTTRLDSDQKQIYKQLGNNEEMRQTIIDSYRSGKKSVTKNIKPVSQKKSTPKKITTKKQNLPNKKHVVTKSLLLIQNEISMISAIDSPFLATGQRLRESLVNNNTSSNSLELTKRFNSQSFKSSPKAKRVNLSKDLESRSIGSVKKSQQFLNSQRSVLKNEQKSQNSQRELIKNVNNYKDLNKLETIKSKKMSKNSKYLTGNSTQGQIKQKVRQPETSYQTQPQQNNDSRNPSFNLGQGQKQGFSLQLGGSSPKNYQNSKQNGNQFQNSQNSKPLKRHTVEEDIPQTDRTTNQNSARHGLGDQYQMKTNLIANQNEVSYGQIQFQGDLGDDMPQSEVSDEESELESPHNQNKITPSDMLQSNIYEPQIMQQEEQKQEIYDYKDLRNQRKQNRQNKNDQQLTNELANMITINDQNSSRLQQSTFIREQREELNHQPAIFSLSVAPEPIIVQNKSFNQNKSLQFQEQSTIKPQESSIETEMEKPQKQTIQDYMKSLKPIERDILRNNLAILIQKWVRGHLTRIWYKKQKEINFKQMRKFRRMLTVAYNRLRSKQVKQIISVMKESGALHADQNYQLWQKYKEHCAIMLQSHWRGYKARFMQIDEINMKIWDCKRKRLLTAVVKGFKTRLLLHPKGYHKALHLIRMDMNKIANQNNGKAMVIDVNDKLTLKNLMRKRRQKVVEYIRQFDKTMKSKSILVSLLKTRRKGPSFSLNESQAQTSKYDISNTSIAWPNKSKDETKVQPKKSTRKWQDVQEDDEPAPLDSMWPSVSVQNQNYDREDSDDEDVKPTVASFWPSKQKEEQESTEAASFWPSKQKDKKIEEESSLSSMWPSKQQEEQKEEESTLSNMWPSKNKPKQKKNKKEVVLEKYSDDNEDDGDDIDWLNLPVKKPVPIKKEQPVQNQNFMVEKQGYVNNFDEQPVGVKKMNNSSIKKQNTNFGEVAQFGVRNSGGVNGAIIPMQEQMDIPIRQSIHFDGETPIAPKYDFEKMIEEAMRVNGETPAVSAAPAVSGDQPVEQKKILTKAKKVDPKKAALLAKRKAYDPRAAVKNAKKQEDNLDTQANLLPSPDAAIPIEDRPIKGKDQSLINQSELNKSQLDENEESPDQQQQADRPPRPFLKRKTKANVLPKKKLEETKPQGKSRIDCWQRDKDPNISYGNKKINRKSLLKKRSTNKIDDDNSPFQEGSAVQAEPLRTNAYRPSPIRSRFKNMDEIDENESIIPDENESNEISQNNINQNGRPSDLSPNNINFYADMQNQNDEEQFNFDGQKLQIDDLEQQFDFLHGANYCQRGDEYSMNNPLPSNSQINSHDFKYSMIPFSEENNSQDVNLYSNQSRIPFLFKENMTEYGIKAQTPSLFFKCYSDDIYEAILEDLRSHYIAISNQDLEDSEENDVESNGHDEDEYGFGQGQVYQNTYTPDQPAVSGAASGGRVNYQNRNRFQ